MLVLCTSPPILNSLVNLILNQMSHHPQDLVDPNQDTVMPPDKFLNTRIMQYDMD